MEGRFSKLFSDEVVGVEEFSDLDAVLFLVPEAVGAPIRLILNPIILLFRNNGG